MMKKGRIVLTLLAFFAGLFYYIGRLLISLQFTPKTKHKELKFQIRQGFCRFSNSIFGIEVRLKGRLPDPTTPYLYISNHRTFYDPIALLSILYADPVSKAEVNKYPLIGWGMKLTGIILLERHNKSERGKTKKAIQENLSSGNGILLFPEGTTYTGDTTKSFKKGSFESAISASVSVIPISVEYNHPSLYWGEISMWEHFKKLLIETEKQHRYLYIKIGDPIAGEDAMILLKETQRIIDQNIVELQGFRN